MTRTEKIAEDIIHRLKHIGRRVLGNDDPFLCVITPVFDPALASLKGLISDLKKQTYGNFIHVMVSNGPSPKVAEYVDKIHKKDWRFIYDELPTVITYEKTGKGEYGDLLKEIGRRRNYAIKKYIAKRYLYLGADFHITDNTTFAQLAHIHNSTHKDIIILNVKAYGSIYPKYPIAFTRIDLSNFTFSRRIARKFGYPTDFDTEIPANDYRYFSRISNTAYMDLVYGSKDGRESYKSLGKIHEEEKARKWEESHKQEEKRHHTKARKK